jgi:hypothetical protein
MKNTPKVGSVSNFWGAVHAGRAVLFPSGNRVGVCRAATAQRHTYGAGLRVLATCRAAGQKNPGVSPGKRYAVQRIGAFGQSNRVSGNGTTLLLTITPAQLALCRRESLPESDA